jgi:hypothetical protein
MFADKTKTLKALEIYFPDSWGYSVNEGSLKAKEVAKKLRENRLKESLSKWLEWAKEQRRFVDALLKLSNLDKSRNKEDLEELRNHILVISFFASPDWYKPTEFESEKIKEHKECLENIISQVKGINRFRKGLEINKNNRFQSKSIHLGYSNRLEVLKKEGLTPVKNKELEHLSLEFLDWLLDSYLVNLEMDGLDIDHINSSFSGGVFIERNRSGALIYPTDLTKQARSEHPEINSYLFHLSMLFRQYTHNEEKNWLSQTQGDMPDYGKPSYKHVANLANSLFSSVGWFENSKYEFLDRNVLERIRKLQKMEVKMSSWIHLGL